MKVLVIGDLHFPFAHKNYLDFIKKVRDKTKPDIIISVGDILDHHAISDHDTDPDGYSPGGEADKALEEIAKWYKEFPDLKVCFGNHDKRIERRAFKSGLSKKFLRQINDIYETPTWTWDLKYIIDNTIYTHGTKCGKYAHISEAMNNRMNFVQGHSHAFGGVGYLACDKDLIFGMNCGCGIDNDSYAMSYGISFSNKPTIGCGFVVDGFRASFIPMNLGRKDFYDGFKKIL